MKKAHQAHEETTVQGNENGMPVGMAFVRGLFVGVVAGAGTMLLFAPKSGKKTRAEIRRQYDEMRDDLLESIEDAEEEVLDKTRHATANSREAIRGKAKAMQHNRHTFFDRS